MNGLVLAGGYSVRMGADKGLLVYHGKPQREIMFDLLIRYCEEVFTSRRPEKNIPSALNPLPDVPGIWGPLNGIMTALAHRRVAWLVVQSICRT